MTESLLIDIADLEVIELQIKKLDRLADNIMLWADQNQDTELLEWATNARDVAHVLTYILEATYSQVDE